MSEQLKEYISVNSNNLITSFVWSGLLDRAKCGELLEIIKQCSVQAVPIEELQEIRQEIEQEKDGYPPSADEYMAINRVIKIVDKHIKEITNEKCD